GGGLYVSGHAEIVDSAVTDNSISPTNTLGGGIHVDRAAASLRVVNSTVSGNVRVGIDTLGPVEVLGSTVVDNGAAFEGSPFTVGGSVLGGSSGPACASSPASSLGYNVVADASCQLGGPGDQ